MFKIRKYFLYILSIVYIILTLIEFIKYLSVDSNLFGLIYMIINLLILFLLIPTAYNYKNNYSKIRFSKFATIIILGLFNSYVLKGVDADEDNSDKKKKRRCRKDSDCR